MVIIGLASFGLLYRLITDPMGLIGQLLYIAVFGVIIFAIFKFIMQKRMGGSINSAFQRAAKQSKRRYNVTNTKPKATSKPNFSKFKSKRTLSTNKRNKDHNFTVIEGKKGKKKNRALF